MNVYLKVTSALDAGYRFCGGLAALFLLLLLIIICAQMVSRWSGLVFPGSTAYAGYCMAASSFLALAYTLGRGAHIRVNLVLNMLGRYRKPVETWCLAVASMLVVMIAWYAVRGTYFSHLLQDISQDRDATPLWIPQLAMAVGTIVAAIAFIDQLIRAIVLGRTGIEAEMIRKLEDDA